MGWNAMCQPLNFRVTDLKSLPTNSLRTQEKQKKRIYHRPQSSPLFPCPGADLPALSQSDTQWLGSIAWTAGTGLCRVNASYKLRRRYLPQLLPAAKYRLRFEAANCSANSQMAYSRAEEQLP